MKIMKACWSTLGTVCDSHNLLFKSDLAESNIFGLCTGDL